ncbi:MAG: hypothetical protein ABIV25_03090 [Paracoccaceae bacterium]
MDTTIKAIKSLFDKWVSLDATWGRTPSKRDNLDGDLPIHARPRKRRSGKGPVTRAGRRADVVAFHDRKGILAFLGRMNAYHTKIEEILASDLAAQSDGGLGIPANESAALA